MCLPHTSHLVISAGLGLDDKATLLQWTLLQAVPDPGLQEAWASIGAPLGLGFPLLEGLALGREWWGRHALHLPLEGDTAASEPPRAQVGRLHRGRHLSHCAGDTGNITS